MNETKEATCAQRIADQLAGEEQNLKEIYAVLDTTNDGAEIDEPYNNDNEPETYKTKDPTYQIQLERI